MVRKTSGDNASSRMLTVKEASRLLGIHPNTLRRWSDCGIISAYRIRPRGNRRFKREDIDIVFREEKMAEPMNKLTDIR